MINWEKQWEEGPGIRKLFLTKSEWVNHKRKLWRMELSHRKEMKKIRQDHEEEIKRLDDEIEDQLRQISEGKSTNSAMDGFLGRAAANISKRLLNYMLKRKKK